MIIIIKTLFYSDAFKHCLFLVHDNYIQDEKNINHMYIHIPLLFFSKYRVTHKHETSKTT